MVICRHQSFTASSLVRTFVSLGDDGRSDDTESDDSDDCGTESEFRSEDSNLRDVGFAAAAAFDAQEQHPLQADDWSQGDGNDSQNLDAAFESLMDGDSISPLW